MALSVFKNFGQLRLLLFVGADEATLYIVQRYFIHNKTLTNNFFIIITKNQNCPATFPKTFTTKYSNLNKIIRQQRTSQYPV